MATFLYLGWNGLVAIFSISFAGKLFSRAETLNHFHISFFHFFLAEMVVENELFSKLVSKDKFWKLSPKQIIWTLIAYQILFMGVLCFRWWAHTHRIFCGNFLFEFLFLVLLYQSCCNKKTCLPMVVLFLSLGGILAMAINLGAWQSFPDWFSKVNIWLIFC